MVMEPELIAVFLCLGVCIGFFSGLLGIGGGLLMIPTLLYLFPLLGLPTFPVKIITGIAVTLGVASSFSTSWTHLVRKNLHLRAAIAIGTGSMLGAYLGGLTSEYISDLWIKGIFVGVLLLILVFSIYSPMPSAAQEYDPDHPPAIKMNPLIWVWGTCVGYLSGILGIGGAIFLVPTMYSFMRIPVRLAIGTGSGVVFLTSISAFSAKWQAGQILLPEAFIITLGGLAGALIGVKVFPKVPVRGLKLLFFTLILLALVRTVWEFL